MPAPRLSFIKVFVSDLDRAAAFYAAVFDFEIGQRVAARDFDEIILRPREGRSGSLVLCRWHDGRDIARGNANGPLGFIVDGVDAVHETALAAGGASLVGPIDLGRARLAFVTDLDGHEIELLDPVHRGERA